MGTTSDFAKLITSNSKVFVSGWPANLKEVVRPKALMFQNGAQHMSIKKIMQKCIVPEALRTKVTTLETIILENMASWEQKDTIIGRDGTMKVILSIAISISRKPLLQDVMSVRFCPMWQTMPSTVTEHHDKA